ncbi:MAG: 3-oxoacyl-[acyl-carrier-protein] synthase [Solirubrobacterales bacterium]|jgi:3-oxoacyl-[acyl-carrier-protein] synthase II|nr:3-oxoacyl-[acyl-carrier-protein] synthase [Solirubrobacterales bacterium]
MTRRVVITGTGAVTPLGVGAETLLDGWIAGRCGIADGEGSCDEFEPTDHLSRKEARRADRFTQLGIVAGDEAIAAAGLDSEGIDHDRIGCVIGTGIGGLTSLEEQVGVLRERGPDAVSPLSVPLMMGNAAAAAVAMRHGIHGQTYGIVSACAAGAHAIGAAARMIQAGDADAVVCGGAEATLTPIAIAAFGSMAATSPTGISRPFDARRDGFVMGEGAGVLVLEEAEAAEERGAEVLGELIGYAATSDAHHLTAPDPSGRAAARAVTLALADAGIQPSEIDYVNAHGTSTPLNDRSETEALKLALGEDAHRVPVSSTKSAIGHLLGAAGAVEAIATLGALRREIAPPTLGYGEPDEGLDLDYVPNDARPLATASGNGGARHIGVSNSFGFGGHNAVLCIAS